VLDGERQGDPAAERVPDQRRLAEVLRHQEAMEEVDERGDLVVEVRLVGAAEADLVDRVHAMLAGERAEARRPGLLGRAEAVQQDHRLAAPGLDVVDALLEHRGDPLAQRTARGWRGRTRGAGAPQRGEPRTAASRMGKPWHRHRPWLAGRHATASPAVKHTRRRSPRSPPEPAA
jgi:hypothetical protein